MASSHIRIPFHVVVDSEQALVHILHGVAIMVNILHEVPRDHQRVDHKHHEAFQPPHGIGHDLHKQHDHMERFRGLHKERHADKYVLHSRGMPVKHQLARDKAINEYSYACPRTVVHDKE